MSLFEHDTIGVFATPITKIKNIQNYSKVLEVLENKIEGKVDVEQVVESGFIKHPHSYNITSYYNHGSILHTYEELNELKDELTHAANFVWHDVMNYDSDLIIVQSWLNDAKQGAMQRTHNHRNCMLCGTLYLNMESTLVFENYKDSTDCSTLFEKPNVDRVNSYGYDFHQQFVSMTSMPGEVLFWPSYVYHGYMNKRMNRRLSLSFNLMPSRINDFYTFKSNCAFN